MWFRKTEIQDFVWVLWVTISQIYWQFWHSFFKYTFKSGSNFHPIEKRGEKWRVQFVWNEYQWKRDVCIHYDVLLYQRTIRLII